MLIDILSLLLFGTIFSIVLTKLKLPRIIGMILGGFIIGPYCLNLLSTQFINETTFITQSSIRTIALMIILMRAGLSLKLEDIKVIGKPAILMCFVPAIFEILAITLLCTFLLSTTIIESILIGTVVAAVSPAIIVPRMIDLIHKGYGTKKKIPQLIMAGGSIDDLFVIVLFTTCTTLLTTNSIHYYTILSIPLSIITAIILGILLANVAKYIYTMISIKYRKPYEIIYIFVVLLMYLESLNLTINALLAIFIMAFTIKQSNDPNLILFQKQLNSIWKLFEILLFTIVGISINPNYIYPLGLIVVIILCISLLFRLFGVFVSIYQTNYTFKEKLFCMLAYTPKATVQAGIGAIPLSLGLACGEIVLSFAVLSILITAPIGAICIDTLHPKLLKKEVHTNE